MPISVDRPIWRADLFETVEGEPGSHDRTHHHPKFHGWEPGRRRFDELVGQEPVEWVGEQLADLDALVARSEVDARRSTRTTPGSCAAAVPEIVDVVRRLLERVRAGELAVAPTGSADLVRNGWSDVTVGVPVDHVVVVLLDSLNRHHLGSDGYR